MPTIDPSAILSVTVDEDAVHARASFACLWDSINGDRATWASDPWVWALTFRRLP